ncbi:retrovirus-related pol polyprotein from transposon TNT 1-94 [Tanacetum coccineum]
MLFRCSSRYNANNQGRPFQRNNARGNVVAGNAGGQNRGGNVNPGQAKPIMCYNCKGSGHIALKWFHNQSVLDDFRLLSKTRMLLMNAHDNVMWTDNEEHVVQSNVTSVRNDAVDVNSSMKCTMNREYKVGPANKSSNGPLKEVKVMEEIFDQMKTSGPEYCRQANELEIESVEIVGEIVKEARGSIKPLDNALNYACQYTKLSQELLEYVIGTCPKSFNERDNKAPSTPITRKKQVTFNDKPGTSSSNTQKHEVHQKVQQTNVHVIHSTGVNTSTEASGSKPRSNTKKNRILPAKTENKKKVEDHPRTNNHEMCVVNILNSVNATPTIKIVLNKGKQIWKPKGKLSDNSLNKTKQVWKATGKLFANVGYQWRSTGKKFTLGKLNCGYQWRPTGKKFALGELCPLTKLFVQCSIITANHQDPNKNWGTEIPNSPHSTVSNADSGMITLELSWVMENMLMVTFSVDLQSILTWSDLDKILFLYRLVHDKKPDLTFLRVFGALCYLTNVSEDLGKFQAKADIRIFVGYAPSRKVYRIYNKRTHRLMETIHVTFDEMHQTMAPVRMSSGPNTSLSTMIAQDAPSISASLSTSDMHHPVRHQGIAEEPTHEDSPINHDVLHPSLNPVTGEPGSTQSSSENVHSEEPNQVNQPPDHLRR